MSARARWAGTAVGTAVGTVVGTGAWLLGLGKLLSTEHPGWALFLLTLVATIVSGAVAKWWVGNAALQTGK